MPLIRTAQQVIQIAREHEEMDPTRGLQLLNEAHIEILGRVHLVPDTTIDISLVADQREYSLPDGCVRVWDAAYYDGASSHTPLKGTNADTLFYDRGANWQLQNSGTPNCFYERGGKIGFDPAPSSPSSGGYPKVTVYYTPYVALGAADSMPSTIPSVYPWVYHMLVHQAGVKNPAKVGFYEARYESEMKHLQEWIGGRVGRNKARIAGIVPRVRRA